MLSDVNSPQQSEWSFQHEEPGYITTLLKTSHWLLNRLKEKKKNKFSQQPARSYTICNPVYLSNLISDYFPLTASHLPAPPATHRVCGLGWAGALALLFSLCLVLTPSPSTPHMSSLVLSMPLSPLTHYRCLFSYYLFPPTRMKALWSQRFFMNSCLLLYPQNSACHTVESNKWLLTSLIQQVFIIYLFSLSSKGERERKSTGTYNTVSLGPHLEKCKIFQGHKGRLNWGRARWKFFFFKVLSEKSLRYPACPNLAYSASYPTQRVLVV